MSRHFRAFVGALAVAGGTTSLAASNAHAGPPTVTCADPVNRPNIVYVAGSTAVKPFLGPAAALLSQQSPPYTIVYQGQGSCTGVTAIYSTNPAQRVITDNPTNYAAFYSADGTTSTPCTLAVGGNVVDVGVSDVFASTCGTSTPAGVEIGDFQGFIQAMTFVVPALSSQTSISAAAAYMVFGMGGNNGVASPWLDPSLFFVRNASSGTQQMIAKAIGVPATQWWGIDRGGSGAVATGLAGLLDVSSAEKGIGILSSDIANEMSSSIRMLYFQATGQSCGYLPDSSPFLFDKANLRDGHYPIWGPEHFYAITNAGQPSAAAAALVSQFAAPQLNQALLDAIIASHVTPKCAMRVTRSTEMGPLSTYTTNARCSCYFEKGATGKTSCQTCTQASDCPSTMPACNYGYCETP